MTGVWTHQDTIRLMEIWILMIDVKRKFHELCWKQANKKSCSQHEAIYRHRKKYRERRQGFKMQRQKLNGRVHLIRDDEPV